MRACTKFVPVPALLRGEAFVAVPALKVVALMVLLVLFQPHLSPKTTLALSTIIQYNLTCICSLVRVCNAPGLVLGENFARAHGLLTVLTLEGFFSAVSQGHVAPHCGQVVIAKPFTCRASMTVVDEDAQMHHPHMFPQSCFVEVGPVVTLRAGAFPWAFAISMLLNSVGF